MRLFRDGALGVAPRLRRQRPGTHPCRRSECNRLRLGCANICVSARRYPATHSCGSSVQRESLDSALKRRGLRESDRHPASSQGACESRQVPYLDL
jgi:hypothetical protein